MSRRDGITRRAFLAVATGAAVSLRSEGPPAAGLAPPPAVKSRVVVIRHDALAADGAGPPPEGVRKLLDEAACALAGDAKAADAWARWFKPADRVAFKVNCLGYSTRPVVAAGFAAAIGAIGLPAGQVTIWDRTCRELQAAGYTLQDRGPGPRCFGTDALVSRGNGGYTADVFTSGAIGSLFSRIITDETSVLVSACLPKDHNLAGLTCALKNFFGAIHNPNKYHENGCDPFVADVCAHPFIRERLRLVVCDAIRPQYNGGPAVRTQWQWPYGGLMLAADPVAMDRVALEILDRKRAAMGMKPLAADKRPVRYLASAQARGLGQADLGNTEVISLGKPWMDVT
jgi:uncharacterized protein (DUF362 family)